MAPPAARSRVDSATGPIRVDAIVDAMVAAHRYRDGDAPTADPVEPGGHFEEAEVVEVRLDPSPEWLIHQTELIRRPVYRSERSDTGSELAGQYTIDFDGNGNAIYGYPYTDDTELQSVMGELNARDMLVMTVVQQAYYQQGCPQDYVVRGLTLYNVAQQIGINPTHTRLVRASITRLLHAKVKIRFNSVERARRDGYQVNDHGEIRFGFISGDGWRQRSVRGKSESEFSGYVRLDPTLGDLLREKRFTFLRASVLRELSSNPIALKLYGWGRTHEPNERGFLKPHRISTLSEKIGCADTNPTRRRRKVIAALNLLCQAAPDEFPGWQPTDKTAKAADPVVELRRRKLNRARNIQAVRGAALA